MASIYVDFDGTIVDPSERLYRLYSEELARLGQRPLGRARYWTLKRRREPEQAIVERTCRVECVADYLSTRQQRIEDPVLLQLDKLVPGAVATLRQLARSHRLALVSARTNASNLCDQLDCLGLTAYFAFIEVCHRPGDPGWRAKAAVLAADPEFKSGDAIMVGDTEDDILAGQSLGLRTAAVLTGIRNRAFLAALRPTVVLATFAELPGWLGKE